MAIGFLEASIHEIIDEGCVVKHIGYIEGWYKVSEIPQPLLSSSDSLSVI